LIYTAEQADSEAESAENMSEHGDVGHMHQAETQTATDPGTGFNS